MAVAGRWQHRGDRTAGAAFCGRIRCGRGFDQLSARARKPLPGWPERLKPLCAGSRPRAPSTAVTRFGWRSAARPPVPISLRPWRRALAPASRRSCCSTACLATISIHRLTAVRRRPFRAFARAHQMFFDIYAGKHDADDPAITPIKGDLQALPPAWICAAECDVLRDDWSSSTRSCGLAQRRSVRACRRLEPRLHQPGAPPAAGQDHDRQRRCVPEKDSLNAIKVGLRRTH